MDFLGLAAHDAVLGLRAMKAVAQADGWESAQESELLFAAARAFGVELDPGDLGPIDPEGLMQSLSGPEARLRVIQAMILMAMMDGEIDDQEVSTIEAYAGRLGIDEPRLHNLRQLAQGRVRLAMLDLARRSFARPVFEDAFKQEGLRGVWKIVGPLMGGARDDALAQRYRSTGQCPEGSLGRAYFDFMERHDLAFPGERYGVPESGVWHDISHVVSGYEATQEDEVLVVSFIAGFSREDPFFWLFAITLQYQLGIKVSPYSPPETGYFKPGSALEALRRGAAMNTDLATWDWWPHRDRPLSQVQAMLGVPPVA